MTFLFKALLATYAVAACHAACVRVSGKHGGCNSDNLSSGLSVPGASFDLSDLESSLHSTTSSARSSATASASSHAGKTFDFHENDITSELGGISAGLSGISGSSDDDDLSRILGTSHLKTKSATIPSIGGGHSHLFGGLTGSKSHGGSKTHDFDKFLSSHAGDIASQLGYIGGSLSPPKKVHHSHHPHRAASARSSASAHAGKLFGSHDLDITNELAGVSGTSGNSDDDDLSRILGTDSGNTHTGTRGSNIRKTGFTISVPLSGIVSGLSTVRHRLRSGSRHHDAGKLLDNHGGDVATHLGHIGGSLSHIKWGNTHGSTSTAKSAATASASTQAGIHENDITNELAGITGGSDNSDDDELYKILGTSHSKINTPSVGASHSHSFGGPANSRSKAHVGHRPHGLGKFLNAHGGDIASHLGHIGASTEWGTSHTSASAGKSSTGACGCDNDLTDF